MDKLPEFKNKFPDIIDFKKAYTIKMVIGFLIILISIMLFAFAGKALETIFYLSTFFIFLIFANRIETIKSHIIKKIDNVLKENSDYSTSKASLNNDLLENEIYYSQYGRIENVLKIISLISIVVFFRHVGDNPNNKFYLTTIFCYALFFVVLSITANNIYKYFHKLVESSFNKITFQEYCAGTSFRKDQILSLLMQYIRKLKIIFILSAFSISVSSFILIYFKKYPLLTLLPIVLIGMLGIITLDINNILIAA